MTLSRSQKRAVLKIAVDLVKIDNQIYGSEVSALDQIRKRLKISTEDIDLTHYMTLSQAVDCLRPLESSECEEVLSLLEHIITADNEIDQREGLLVAAIRMVLQSTQPAYATIISALDSHVEVCESQMIYLEQQPVPSVQSILSNPYEYILLNHILSAAGIQLFYLPKVLEQLREQYDETNSQFGILRKSIEYVVPTGTTKDLTHIKDSLDHIDQCTFSKFICSQAHIHLPDVACLLVAIQDGYVLDDDVTAHRCVDYLCIHVTSDFKKRLIEFVKILQRPHYSLSYKGYYKSLIDFLSQERQIKSSILIAESREFVLSDLDNHVVRFTSSPQAKSLYLLLLKSGRSGIGQKVWKEAETTLQTMSRMTWDSQPAILRWLFEQQSPSSTMLYNLLLLYRYFSNREADSRRTIAYLTSIVTHKSSLKNYINNAFRAITHLANKEHYFVQYNLDIHSYCVELDVNMFSIQSDTETMPLKDSAMWRSLL